MIMEVDTNGLVNWWYEILHPLGVAGLIIFTSLVVLLIVFREYISDYFKHRNAIKLAKLKSSLDDKRPPVVEAQLKVTGAFTQTYDNYNNPISYVEVVAVNIGTITAYIKGVYLEMVPAPSTIGPEKIPMPAPQTATLGQTPKTPIELKPHGDTRTWQIPVNERMQFRHKIEGEDKLGLGYIELTTGKRFTFDFYMISEEDWKAHNEANFLRHSVGKVGRRCIKCGNVFMIDAADISNDVRCPRCKTMTGIS